MIVSLLVFLLCPYGSPVIRPDFYAADCENLLTKTSESAATVKGEARLNSPKITSNALERCALAITELPTSHAA